MNNFDITVMAVRYLVRPAAIAETDRNAHVWTLSVGYRREGLWSVEHVGLWLTGDGAWTADRGQAARWDLDTATARACEALRGLTVNGQSVADYIARTGRGR